VYQFLLLQKKESRKQWLLKFNDLYLGLMFHLDDNLYQFLNEFIYNIQFLQSSCNWIQLPIPTFLYAPSLAEASIFSSCISFSTCYNNFDRFHKCFRNAARAKWKRSQSCAFDHRSYILASLRLNPETVQKEVAA